MDGGVAMQRDMDLVVARIRGLQAIYAEAHAALKNWGAWSDDRRGIFPTMSPPGMWAQYRPNEGEDYGEEGEIKEPPALPPKAEPAPKRSYDERAGVALDERMHGPGGLSLEVRQALRIAYVSREVPETQFHVLAGCSRDAFCERLEGALRFVGRFL